VGCRGQVEVEPIVQPNFCNASKKILKNGMKFCKTCWVCGRIKNHKNERDKLLYTLAKTHLEV
jgi:hypothetical protein